MSKPDLDAIQARVDAATEGPWGWDHGNPRRVLDGKNGEQIMACAVLLYPERRNAEFIAAARTDVPALLAYARDLEARLAKVHGYAEIALTCEEGCTDLATEVLYTLTATEI